MKIEQNPSSDSVYDTREANEPSLASRVRDAANALSAKPVTGASEAPSAERGSDGRIYFVLDLSNGTAIEGDTEEDEWQPPPSVPLLASIPLPSETSPAPEVQTYSLGGDPDASMLAQGNTHDRSQSGDRPASRQAANQDSVNRMLTAANRGVTRIQNIQGTRQAAAKTQKLEPSNSSLLGDTAGERGFDFFHSATMRVQDTRESGRSERALDRDSEKEHTSLNGVAVRAPLMLFAQAGPPQEKLPQDNARSTRTAQYQAPQAAASASKPQELAEAERDDSYEVTYRFTSWSNDATVKLKLNNTHKGGRVLATPSNAKVHHLLTADLSAGTSRMGEGSGAPSVELAAPSIMPVDADEQNRQRQRQQPDASDEDIA